MFLKLVTISSVLAVLAQSAPLATSHDTITYAYALDLSAPVVKSDLQSIRNGCRHLHLLPGLVSDHQWVKTLNKYILLWYSNVQSGGVNEETKPNFDDYIAFGNWASPSIKQFAQVERVCQITVNRDVYAVSGSVLEAENLKMEDGRIRVGGLFH
uniref:Uncharacterized protein n=1 Tax=Caenorhabditis brenneri TaxID=135651 RepID=B6VBR4_CAEBE|nr:hypothetical protein Cbre_JD21.004 [Caenorhabditis brenneri]